MASGIESQRCQLIDTHMNAKAMKNISYCYRHRSPRSYVACPVHFLMETIHLHRRCHEELSRARPSYADRKARRFSVQFQCGRPRSSCLDLLSAKSTTTFMTRAPCTVRRHLNDVYDYHVPSICNKTFHPPIHRKDSVLYASTEYARTSEEIGHDVSCH